MIKQIVIMGFPCENRSRQCYLSPKFPKIHTVYNEIESAFS